MMVKEIKSMIVTRSHYSRGYQVVFVVHDDVPAGTTNPRGTRKQDNPLEGIRIPIPRNPDNPLKGIRYLVHNGTWSQCPRGLTILTQC